MQAYLLCAFIVTSVTRTLSIDVPVPDYEISYHTLTVNDGVYLNAIGAPAVPSRRITIALPPGALVEKVDFSGTRYDAGYAMLEATFPPLPLSITHGVEELWRAYLRNKDQYYSSPGPYPEAFGTVLAFGGLRKYRVLDIACHHFAYNPISHLVTCAPCITVIVHYRMTEPGKEEAQFWKKLQDDVTFDRWARTIIYNWQDAETWYHTDTPRQAHGYYIIVPSGLETAVDTLVHYRQNQGYDVHVVTKEYIEANIAGDDIPQKFRNYLRQHMADIEYALLVGFSTDMPWRSVVPFNNDPDSPWNNYDYSPIPSDLYLAELTDPDSLSWNSDGDAYYGEVFDENFQPVGEDDPDYHADIHLGRIPFSTPSTIEDICVKLIQFDMNTDVSYKTASLLTGALYYYANENNSGNARVDGAHYCEQLLIDSILPRSTAVTLYEKGGLRPCTLSCTDSLVRSNHIAYWQNKGVMYECHHGNVALYARKLWAWDDGDSIPETPEIEWPTSLYYTDVYQLDNTHPATCFLRSCLCGKPEETGLGAMLLYRGGSGVISSSRVSWASAVDQQGIPYHFYKRLLQDTVLSNGIIGNAYDIARNDFMDGTGFWLPAYHYNLFGDPALRQYGMLVGITDQTISQAVHLITAFPNPTYGRITLQLPVSSTTPITFDIYDESGRYVKSLSTGNIADQKPTFDLMLPAGVYFIKMKNNDVTVLQKIVILR
jgi:hypothetical protein